MAGALLGALLAFGIGGASLAFAQTADDNTTPTTQTPAAGDTAPAPVPGPRAHDDANCPNMGGSSGGGGGGGATPSGATTPSV
ncbi:MAG: hypothetical protein QOF60_2968 [Actinomycetota bacterium]|jgi:hypothetical protein|nr:hypothetical protein [Actinomycetota bacterium]